ncbi:MAG: hypothetical protein LH660_02420 [Phormidesmis sp. CAN_BIN36]|nr:hypothetical protein [Phormidesmis sp. CAN_BIN36]
MPISVNLSKTSHSQADVKARARVEKSHSNSADGHSSQWQPGFTAAGNSARTARLPIGGLLVYLID